MRRISATILLLLVLLASVSGQPVPSSGTPRFQAVDIYVDSRNAPLAAYQLEFSVKSGNGTVVGVEGGEHSAFKEAPYHDPKAIQQERVIIAAFNTGATSQLPSGKTRVATIHLRINDNGSLRLEIKNTTAATANGKRFTAEATFVERKSK